MEVPCDQTARQIQLDIIGRHPKIPRPANAFMLYANENRKKMARAFPLDSNKEISKRLGKGWKELNQEEKNVYYAMAKKVDDEHKRKYPDYVYNPKEARIRKAMRDACRDRTIGVAPSSRGGRRSQPWVMSESEDQFMMTPTHSMRGVVASPMCGNGFPIGNVPPNGQFMQPMHSYNKHMHLLPHESNNYMQANPMAQLQHQTEMWHQYHQSPSPMRTNQSEQFMLPPSQMPTYHHPQEMPPPPAEVDKVKVPEEGVVVPFTGAAERPGRGSPRAPNENNNNNHNNNNNAPPNEQQQQQQQQQRRPLPPEAVYEGKPETNLDPASLPPTESPYIGVYHENVLVQNPFDKAGESLKIKKLSTVKPQKSLPDFNEAFGSTERGRFQSPPDPRPPHKQGYLDYIYPNNDLKFEDYHI